MYGPGSGPAYPVLVKLNLSDGFRRGFTLEDCIYVSQELEKNGCTAIVLSGGFTSKSPFYLMRGEDSPGRNDQKRIFTGRKNYHGPFWTFHYQAL